MLSGFLGKDPIFLCMEESIVSVNKMSIIFLQLRNIFPNITIIFFMYKIQIGLFPVIYNACMFQILWEIIPI